MIKHIFSRAAWVKTRTLTATLVAGTGAGTGGSRSSPFGQKRGSDGGDATLVDSVGEGGLKIYRQTELSVKLEDKATLEGDRHVEVNGLGAPTGCSYQATCEFLDTSSSASSSYTVSGER